MIPQYLKGKITLSNTLQESLLDPPEPRTPPREPYTVDVKKDGARVEWRKENSICNTQSFSSENLFDGIIEHTIIYYNNYTQP